MLGAVVRFMSARHCKRFTSRQNSDENEEMWEETSDFFPTSCVTSVILPCVAPGRNRMSGRTSEACRTSHWQRKQPHFVQKVRRCRAEDGGTERAEGSVTRGEVTRPDPLCFSFLSVTTTASNPKSPWVVQHESLQRFR